MGQALLEYWQTQKVPEDIRVLSDLAEDDVLPVPYMFREWEAMPEWERIALKHCRGRVLDIGAGAGSHALWLENQGHPVTAVEVSEGATKVMQARGLKDVRHLDVYDLAGEQYDTLLLLMNGIGLVEDLEGLSKFLDFAPSLLVPGGQILFDSSDLMYMYPDPDIALLQPQYYGEVRFQLQYRGSLSEEFGWLYLDYELLTSYATRYQYHCERLFTGDHYEYLARLSPMR